MEELEFTPEATAEAFSDMPIIGPKLQEAEVTPEELAAFLNDAFDMQDRQMINAMRADHRVDLDIGGEARVSERRGYEKWAEESGYADQ